MKIHKAPIITLLCCLILISFQSAANNNANSNLDLISLKKQGYQIFNKDNFVIKCNSKLKINTVLMKMAKEKGFNNIVSSYIASENQNSEKIGVIYTVQISDVSSIFSNNKIKLSQAEICLKFMDTYCKNLKANNMNYTRSSFLGLNSVEYTFLQNEVLPSKAIIFIKNKQLYLLQVGTRKNLSLKYTNLKNSFKFIK